MGLVCSGDRRGVTAPCSAGLDGAASFHYGSLKGTVGGASGKGEGDGGGTRGASRWGEWGSGPEEMKGWEGHWRGTFWLPVPMAANAAM